MNAKCKNPENPELPETLQNKALFMRKELYDRGVYVNPSLPPATVSDECLLRTSLMVTHTEEQIETAVAIIAEVLHKHRIGI